MHRGAIVVRAAREFLRNHGYLRFLIVGGVNTAFGFVLYSLGILAGLQVWVALMLGNVAGTVFSFYTTGSYVFRELSLSRFPRFIVCYLVVYLVNLAALGAIAPWLGDKILAQAVLALPMAGLSYFILLRLVFAPGKAGS